MGSLCKQRLHLFRTASFIAARLVGTGLAATVAFFASSSDCRSETSPRPAPLEIERDSNPVDRRDFAPLSVNQALAEAVAKKLRTARFRGSVEIVVDDGEVLLQGDVSYAADRDAATRIAYEVVGVRSVKNELTVGLIKRGPPSGQAIGEQAIAETVASRIAQSFAVFDHRMFSIEVLVDGGGKLVTLRGFVVSATAKDSAVRAARRVPGVRSVTDRLVVVPIAEKSSLEVAGGGRLLPPVEAPRPDAIRDRPLVTTGRATVPRVTRW